MIKQKTEEDFVSDHTWSSRFANGAPLPNGRVTNGQHGNSILTNGPRNGMTNGPTSGAGVQPQGILTNGVSKTGQMNGQIPNGKFGGSSGHCNKPTSLGNGSLNNKNKPAPLAKSNSKTSLNSRKNGKDGDYPR